jgi:hypothetical protein
MEVPITTGDHMEHDDGIEHYVPLDDCREHIADPNCWCEPVYEVDEEGELYLHNSADGREAYQDGIRKPH